MIQYNEVETQIIATIEQFEKDVHSQKLLGNTLWTYLLKERLGSLGQDEYECNVCASGHDNFDGEWLYDLVWYKEEGMGEECKLVEVPLVMECEWNMSFGHIRFDFEKLLVANATHHLMVCDVHEYKVDFMLDYFRKAINAYRFLRSGDRFLFALLNHETEKFSFHLILKN